MLKLFEVSGFKNFKDTVRLDFSDIRDYKFNPQCITNGLIGKAIIYGKNSIGKSNFAKLDFPIEFFPQMMAFPISPLVMHWGLNLQSRMSEKSNLTVSLKFLNPDTSNSFNMTFTSLPTVYPIKQSKSRCSVNKFRIFAAL